MNWVGIAFWAAVLAGIGYMVYKRVKKGKG